MEIPYTHPPFYQVLWETKHVVNLTTVDDDPVAGCTDPSAINYNENCQGVDVSAANNGQGALIDDGCCTLSTKPGQFGVVT